MALTLLVPLVLWFIALEPRTRNGRFLLFLGGWTVAWIIVALVVGEPGPLAAALAVGALLVWGFAVRLGLGSLTPDDIRDGALIRRVAAWSDRWMEASDLEAIGRLIERPGLDLERRVAARLARWSKVRPPGEVGGQETPAEWFGVAAKAYLEVAESRRVIGARPTTSPWDELFVLSLGYEDVYATIDRRQEEEVDIDALVGDFAALPFHDPIAAAAQDRMIPAIRAFVALNEHDTEATREPQARDGHCHVRGLAASRGSRPLRPHGCLQRHTAFEASAGLTVTSLDYRRLDLGCGRRCRLGSG
jgi:hypothetical protein